MTYTLLLHIASEEPILVETERMPEPTDNLIVCMHPRRRDNKSVHWVLDEVTTVIFPLARVSFIEIMPSGEDEAIFKPFRD